MSDINNNVLDDKSSPLQIADIQKCLTEVKIRITNAINKGSIINSKIKKSEKYLQNHIGSKQTLVVLYVDLVDSTLMMRDFSVDILSTIIQIFNQEMSIAISYFSGHVLKFVGDAVIAFFPIDADTTPNDSYNNAINCAFYMINVLNNAINPILKQKNLGQLHVRIGIDIGEHYIIQYILEEKPHTDIIGYGISMACKLTKLVNPDQIATSHLIYINMNSSLRKKFTELEISPRIWKYIDGKIQKGIWKSLI
jgi:class 3 adenylate cyclase